MSTIDWDLGQGICVMGCMCAFTGPGKMVGRGENLLHKPEDLSSSPQHSYTKLGPATNSSLTLVLPEAAQGVAVVCWMPA